MRAIHFLFYATVGFNQAHTSRQNNHSDTFLNMRGKRHCIIQSSNNVH